MIILQVIMSYKLLNQWVKVPYFRLILQILWNYLAILRSRNGYIYTLSCFDLYNIE